jgi:acetylornithine deacetylase/succinyl-diaminopimelate desuccinylase-like protein
LADAIRTVLARHLPGAHVAAAQAVGFTDSNWFRAAFPEVVAYDFAPHLEESIDEVTARYHNADERILVRDLGFQALFAERVALELLQ